MKRIRTRFRNIFMISIVIFITGCTIKLAPDYDKDLVDTLIVTNAKTMEFFASIVDGTKAEEFSKREKTYNKLIGQFDALALQAGARPIPNNDITEKINRHLEDRGINVVDDGAGPSATAMQKISETLQKLRSTDKKQGVTRLEVAAFKGQVSIYMDQALTYEQFLER